MSCPRSAPFCAVQASTSTLEGIERATAAKLVEYERRNGNDGVLPGQKAPLQALQAAATKLQQGYNEAEKLAAKADGPLARQPPALTYCKLQQCSATGDVQLQLLPVAPSVHAAWAAEARSMAASCLASLEDLQVVLRTASTLLLAVILEDSSKRHTGLAPSTGQAAR